MIYRFVYGVLRHDQLILCVTALGLIIAVWSLGKTPVDALPDLSENQVLVYTPWPGQRPTEIDRHISGPLAVALQDIPGLVSIRGSSEVNFSLLNLLFEDAVPFDEARKRVATRLHEIQLDLPASVRPQLAADGIPTGQVFWYTVEGVDTDLVELRRIQDEIVAPQMRTLHGVAEVASVGGFCAEYHLHVDVQNLVKNQVSAANLETLRVGAVADRPELSNVTLPSGLQTPAKDLGRLVLGTAPRSGLFEKDGTEVVAGIVHMRYGHNTLAVTRSALDRLQQISANLPPNIRLVPCYDRTALISGAIWTVTSTLLESMIVASLCVVLILRHWRTSLVISLTLPLAVLGAFLAIWVLRISGVADIQANIMSLAGIVVSIGVLVDSAIVITDNVSHQLRARFGDQPVRGDTRALVAEACTSVGWPAFLAILVMLVSFLPIFALQGIDGRMYRPLAWTKSLSLASVALLTITVVPVLCHKLLRGRIRPESESRIVQSFVRVYRPMLEYLLDRPLPLIVVLAATLVLGSAATGSDGLIRLAIGLGLVACWYLSTSVRSRVTSISLVLVIGLTGPAWMRPIGISLRVPLDEGMVMDMPITVPNISVAQAGDDLKARNMMLCRFPEVAMVSGKAGRAETAFDPAPMDMIETMVELRPASLWPSRRLMHDDAASHAREVIKALQEAQLVESSENLTEMVDEIVNAGLPRFDAVQREVCWQRLQVMQKELGRDLSIELTAELLNRLHRCGYLTSTLDNAEARGIASEIAAQDIKRLGQQVDRVTISVMVRHILAQVQAKHFGDAAPSVPPEALVSRLTSIQNWYRELVGDPPVTLAEELLAPLKQSSHRVHREFVRGLNLELRRRAATTWTQIVCSELVTRRSILDESLRAKWTQVIQARYAIDADAAAGNVHHHQGIPPTSRLPIIDPHSDYDQLLETLTTQFANRIWLWPHDRNSLTGPGGELDSALTMPGWANVWTRPIQNRVDMLASGVNSEVGVRVMGHDLEQVAQMSELVAEILQQIPGTADVFSDPIRGKDYTDWVPAAQQWKRLGLDPGDADGLVALAEHGRVIGKLGTGTNPLPLRIRLTAASLDELGHVQTTPGPATIKSENGRLRNYVRFNIRGREPNAVVNEAKREIDRLVNLPSGMVLEWTGQYEHAARTRKMLLWMIPIVLVLIGTILYAVFRDWVDSGLMLMSVPGALAGGAICQWLLDVPFSVAVGVGYIACFGMAAATSMIMLVYLRQSVEQAGPLRTLSDSQLRSAVINGAVQRLRPKLLTEATMIFSLAPMLWSVGAGADVIRPMAAPVLGGILVADEVVDLLIPVAFYRLRKWRRDATATDAYHVPGES